MSVRANCGISSFAAGFLSRMTAGNRASLRQLSCDVMTLMLCRVFFDPHLAYWPAFAIVAFVGRLGITGDEMRPSYRVLIAFIVIELLLGGIAAYLIFQLQTGAMSPTTSVAEASATITSTMGALMGALGGVMFVVFIVLRRKES